MLEEINTVPVRIASLRSRLKAREGQAEYKANVEALKAEITRLETATLKPA